MEKQKLLDIARRSMDAFNARDWNRFGEVLSPNAVYDEIGTGRRVTGRDSVVDLTRGWSVAFPDLKGTIDHSVASDDYVLCEVTYKGTQDGELKAPSGSVAPSHKPVTTRCVQSFHVADGHVVEMRNYFDMLHVLQAVNALPSKTT